MRILLLTSKDHPYANALLNLLIGAGAFSGCEVHVLEQDCVLPDRSTLGGLWRYIRTAGMHYTAAQILKQYLFRWRRARARRRREERSLFYPYARRQGVMLHQAPFHTISSSPARAWIADLRPALLLSVLSKEIVSGEVLAIPRLGALNVHPALLPSYKGVSPTFWVLSNGDSRAGVTLHWMDRGIDTGGIISQTTIQTAPYRTEHALYMRAIAEAAILLTNALARLKAGESLPALPLPPSVLSSYFSLPTRGAVRSFRRRGYRFFAFAEFS